VSEITRILERAHQGDPKAADELLPLVYDELRRLATAKMAQQPPGQTLQGTALVHEAWLRLTAQTHSSWQDRQHFLRAAAEAMREILVDRARSKQRLKRGAGQFRVNLDDVGLAAEATPETVLLVDEALEALVRSDVIDKGGPTTPIPELRIDRSGGALEVRWPVTATNYVLEAVDQLGSAAIWSPVTDTISSVGADGRLHGPRFGPDPILSPPLAVARQLVP
jgi:RNA polymerase sigma factor (TIGR02999 family)